MEAAERASQDLAPSTRVAMATGSAAPSLAAPLASPSRSSLPSASAAHRLSRRSERLSASAGHCRNSLAEPLDLQRGAYQIDPDASSAPPHHTRRHVNRCCSTPSVPATYSWHGAPWPRVGTAAQSSVQAGRCQLLQQGDILPRGQLRLRREDCPGCGTCKVRGGVQRGLRPLAPPLPGQQGVEAVRHPRRVHLQAQAALQQLAQHGRRKLPGHPPRRHRRLVAVQQRLRARLHRPPSHLGTWKRGGQGHVHAAMQLPLRSLTCCEKPVLVDYLAWPPARWARRGDGGTVRAAAGGAADPRAKTSTAPARQ